MNSYLAQTFLVITYILQALIFVRVVLSWLPLGYNPVVAFVFQLTEPLLSPLRRILPRFGVFDLAPMIALLLIVLVQRVVVAALP